MASMTRARRGRRLWIPSTSPTGSRWTDRARLRTFAPPPSSSATDSTTRTTPRWRTSCTSRGRGSVSNAAATPTTSRRSPKRRGTIADVIPPGQTEAQGGAAPVGHLGQHSVYEWSRENFRSSALNVRWSKDRLVRTGGGAFDTPQVVLGIRALRVPHYPRDVRRRALLRQLQLRLDRNRGLVQHAHDPQIQVVGCRSRRSPTCCRSGRGWRSQVARDGRDDTPGKRLARRTTRSPG